LPASSPRNEHRILVTSALPPNPPRIRPFQNEIDVERNANLSPATERPVPARMDPPVSRGARGRAVPRAVADDGVLLAEKRPFPPGPQPLARAPAGDGRRRARDRPDAHHPDGW